jgi:hypothetical protein
MSTSRIGFARAFHDQNLRLLALILSTTYICIEIISKVRGRDTYGSVTL